MYIHVHPSVYADANFHAHSQPQRHIMSFALRSVSPILQPSFLFKPIPSVRSRRHTTPQRLAFPLTLAGDVSIFHECVTSVFTATLGLALYTKGIKLFLQNVGTASTSMYSLCLTCAFSIARVGGLWIVRARCMVRTEERQLGGSKTAPRSPFPVGLLYWGARRFPDPVFEALVPFCKRNTTCIALLPEQRKEAMEQYALKTEKLEQWNDSSPPLVFLTVPKQQYPSSPCLSHLSELLRLLCGHPVVDVFNVFS